MRQMSTGSCRRAWQGAKENDPVGLAPMNASPEGLVDHSMVLLLVMRFGFDFKKVLF